MKIVQVITNPKVKLITSLATILLATLSVTNSTNMFYRLGAQLGLAILLGLIGIEEMKKPEKKYPYLYFVVSGFLFITFIVSLIR